MNTQQPITVNIDSSTLARAALFVAAVALLYFLHDVLLVFLVAIVIASALEPITQSFEHHHIPRVAAVIFIYLMLALGLASLVYFVIPPLLVDVQSVLSQAPEYIRSLQLGSGADLLERLGFRSGAFDEPISLTELVREVRFALGGESFSIIEFISGIFGGLVSFVLIVTISFYLAVQRHGIADFLRVITPLRHEDYVINLWTRSQRKIGLWLQGQLLLMLIVGLLVYIGLLILGVPNALLFAAIAAVFEIIPLFGPILAAIPAITMGLLTGGVSLALLVAGLFLLVQQLENNLIYPLVVKKVVGVPALIVIISLVIGAQLAGFLGVILAVPVAAVILEWVHDYEGKKAAKKLAPKETEPTTSASSE